MVAVNAGDDDDDVEADSADADDTGHDEVDDVRYVSTAPEPCHRDDSRVDSGNSPDDSNGDKGIMGALEVVSSTVVMGEGSEDSVIVVAGESVTHSSGRTLPTAANACSEGCFA